MKMFTQKAVCNLTFCFRNVITW